MQEYTGDDDAHSCPYFYLWDMEGLGKLSAYATMALVKGDITGAEYETFTAGDMGEFTITKAITKVMRSNKKSHSVAEILNTKPARIATRADKACLRILRSSLIAVKIPVIANSRLEVKSRFFHFLLLSCESIGCQNLFL